LTSSFSRGDLKLAKLGSKLKDFWEDLGNRKTDMVVVVDAQGVARGVITVWDCLKALRDGINFETARVEDIMSFPPITVRETVPVEETVGKLLTYRIKNLVVVNEENKPTGIVNIADALRGCVAKGQVLPEYCRLENVRVAVVGGSGRQGLGLALRLAKAGFKVLVGSRSREKALETANEISRVVPGSKVEGGLDKEVVRGADTIFLAIPYEALEEATSRISGSLNSGHILITPIVPMRVTGREVMPAFEGISAAERIALMTRLTGAKTVAAFHTIPAETLKELDNPLGFDVLMCGDDPEAKRRVAGLVASIPNLRPIDAGPLKNALIIEIFTGLLIYLGRTTGKRDLSIKLI